MGVGLTGCVSIPGETSLGNDSLTPAGQEQPNNDSKNNDKSNQDSDSVKPAKRPKALMEWSIPANEKEDGKNGEDNGGKNGDDEAEKRLDPDRPHLPEAASTVGLDRVILESGYTYTSKGPMFLHQHSYPEALLRIGMLAEWFELRVSQNFINQKNQPGLGQPANENGAQDMEIGFKLAVAEQKKYMPETAIIFQTSVPCGASQVSNDTVLPGINLDLGWEIIKDCFGVETVTSANGARDDAQHTYVNFVQGITTVFDLTRNLELFTEYNLFVPIGAISPDATHPQHYIVGGFVYFINNNLEVDIRAGVGLNDHASDYLVGTGFAARY
jgi:hypothetical protein